jgi:hypothetical protein
MSTPSPSPEEITTAATMTLRSNEKSTDTRPLPKVEENQVETSAANASPKPEPALSEVAVSTPLPKEIVAKEQPGQPSSLTAERKPPSTPISTSVAEPAAKLVITGMTPEVSKPGHTAAGKPLFEPVIITVPKTEVKKAGSNEPSAGAEPDGKKPEEKRSSKSKSVFIEPAAEGRPRIIDGKEVQMADVPPCEINVSQDSLSIINNGSIGILVGIDGDGELKALKAVSSNPADVGVTLEPEIAGVSGRALYVVKSLNSTTGTYKVLFELDCGKKEITVTVR